MGCVKAGNLLALTFGISSFMRDLYEYFNYYTAYIVR
jgi:hypothetical protein